MANINDALVKIYLLEKESSNNGLNKTIEMVSSYATNNSPVFSWRGRREQFWHG